MPPKASAGAFSPASARAMLAIARTLFWAMSRMLIRRKSSRRRSSAIGIAKIAPRR